MTGRRMPLLVLVIVLLVASAVLAWQIYRQLAVAPMEPRISKAVAVARPTLRPEPLAIFAMPPQDRFGAILQRPLFSPSRRLPPGAEVPLDAGMGELHMILTGIVHSAAERIVLLRPEGGGGIVLLQEGETYDGWTLAEVKPGQAVFQNGARQVVLEVVFDLEGPLPGREGPAE